MVFNMFLGCPLKKKNFFVASLIDQLLGDLFNFLIINWIKTGKAIYVNLRVPRGGKYFVFLRVKLYTA